MWIEHPMDCMLDAQESLSDLRGRIRDRECLTQGDPGPVNHLLERDRRFRSWRRRILLSSQRGMRSPRYFLSGLAHDDGNYREWCACKTRGTCVGAGSAAPSTLRWRRELECAGTERATPLHGGAPAVLGWQAQS